MTDFGMVTLFAILILLGGAVVVIAILGYLYFSLKSRVSQQVEYGLSVWRERELDAIRKEQAESAQQQALAQLQQWREQELDSVRKQQLEVARSEACVQLEQWKTEYSQGIRQQAIQQSQAVTLGKITEHFVPYLPDFVFNPKDARFLGSPIDFVVFDGLNEGEVKRIVLLEVKTGMSTLNTRERKIRDAVQSGKVEWMEIRPQLELSQTTQTLPTHAM